MHSKIKLFILINGLSLSALAHAAIPNTDHPDTFVGNVLQLNYADLINDTFQYSVTGDVGANQQRIGLTGGYRADKYERLKVTVEYLRQNIGYSFFSGNQYQWTGQSAVDFRYQYRYVDKSWRPSVALAGYMAHTPDTTLRTTTGTYIPADTGVPTAFVNDKRVAGAFSTGLVGDFGADFWKGNHTGFGVYYDNVRYDNRNEANHEATGLGGSLYISQVFKGYIGVGGSAQWRQQFNDYDVYASMNNLQYKGSWTVGVDYNYVRGKERLPSTKNFGLFVNYSPQLCHKDPKTKYKDKSAAPSGWTLADKREMLAWIAKPAVFMPQALAIADEGVDD